MANGHPFLEETISLSNVDVNNYGIVYDISTICAITESKELDKNKKHRSDIWANYCGVELENHEMYLYPDTESARFCVDLLKK